VGLVTRPVYRNHLGLTLGLIEDNFNLTVLKAAKSGNQKRLAL
jgi:hypothetical protein